MSKYDPKDPVQISKMAEDPGIKTHAAELFNEVCRYRYSYNFSWLGRPIIQFPQDIVAMQEIIWSVKPDLIFETGIAHGGSLILSASILEMIGGDGEVLGLDIDIRSHNRKFIEDHPLYKRITMIEGSSIDDDVAEKVFSFAENKKKILIILDSNHTHAHVAKELELYSRLVKKGSYLLVYDTVIEDMPDDFFPGRDWAKGNNPKTAVRDFLKSNNRFQIDYEIQNKLLLTVAPDGYLKCVND